MADSQPSTGSGDARTTPNLNTGRGAVSTARHADEQVVLGVRDRLPGRDAKRFGMCPAVVFGQDLTEVARAVGNGLTADLAARHRKVGYGHWETAGT